MEKSNKGKTRKRMREEYGLRLVHADVTLRSKSGKSIHDKDAQIDSKTVRDYLPAEGIAQLVEEVLVSMNLRIIAKSKITICVAAPIGEFQKIFNVKLARKRFFPYAVPKEQRVPDEKGCGIKLEYNGGKRLPIPELLEGLVDAIHLSTPAFFCQDPDPPHPDYFHLKVPGDIARLVDAVQCHNDGIDGSGVRLAMPDQGTFDHPYYTSRGYDITLDESAYDETADTGSHGTAIAANALAVAPGIEFIGIRTGKKISSATAAFQQAVEHNPDVMSISWGTEGDVADLRAAVALAIADGIVICCACGNGGMLVFPSSMPEVVSVGGSYADETDHLEASTYASSGILTNTDSGRQMPDLTGFVGHEPKGIYITLPCHSGSDEDQYFAGGVFPDCDETTDSDGWLVASGTSSATPQVAAVACLLMEADPTLRGSPAAIKQRLTETAIDVTTGNSANLETAAIGVDNATGGGVVDAFIATNRVDVWIRDNANDRGLVPSRGAHWNSPDIKVLAAPLANPENEFDTAGHIDRPVYGNAHYVYIKVGNRGVDDANDVMVNFYYADPCTFNSYPDDWKNGQSGDPMQGTIEVDGIATNQILIDVIPGKQFRVAGPFVWSPPLPTGATEVETTAEGKSQGHFCLLARIECAADPVTWPGGAQPTVWLDNNIGMKNLWVVEPDVVYPLVLGQVRRAVQRTWLLVDTVHLPKNCAVQLRVPKRIVGPASLKQYEVVESETQEGVVYVEVPAAKQSVLDIATTRRVPLRYRITASGQVPRTKSRINERYASMSVSHFADGTCIGGASMILDLLALEHGKKSVA